MASEKNEMIGVTTNGESKAPIESAPAAAVAENDLRALLIKHNVGDADAVLQQLNELGAESAEDLKVLQAEDLCKAGIKLVKAYKILGELKGEPEPAAPAAKTAAGVTGGTPMMPVYNMTVSLPEVPNDESWLAGLKTGGILKCNNATYVSAVRAAIADRLDVRQLPKKLCDLIKAYAEENDAPVPEQYWELRRLNSRREYAEIFAIIGGESNVTDSDRKALNDRMKRFVWPAASYCFHQLRAWMQEWQNTLMNPNTILSMAHGVPSPMANSIPDTSAIRDSGDELRNAINRALSGVGPAAAAAMACDYNRVKKILNDPELPARIGVAGREQLFKKLGIDVSSSLIRTENDLVQFILGMASADEQLTSESEAAYYNALYNLGSHINWADLGVSVGERDVAQRAASFEGLTGGKL